MSLFRCEDCGCVENTALSNFWMRRQKTDGKALCSECDPGIGKWHGRFPKTDADEAGYQPIPDSHFIEGPPSED